MNPPDMVTINGTLRDVATFFTVCDQTVKRWIKQTPPLIAVWRQGGGPWRAGHLMFGEEAVIDFALTGYLAARRLAPGEAREIIRREWREHLRARQQERCRMLKPELCAA